MRTSVVLHTTTTTSPPIWTIVWMLDGSVRPAFESGFLEDIMVREPCADATPHSPVLTFIHIIDFLLGGSGCDWTGVFTEWEQVLHALEDQIRIPVGPESPRCPPRLISIDAMPRLLQSSTTRKGILYCSMILTSQGRKHTLAHCSIFAYTMNGLMRLCRISTNYTISI